MLDGMMIYVRDFSSSLLGEQDLSWFLVATPDFIHTQKHTQNRVLPNLVVNHHFTPLKLQYGVCTFVFCIFRHTKSHIVGFILLYPMHVPLLSYYHLVI